LISAVRPFKSSAVNVSNPPFAKVKTCSAHWRRLTRLRNAKTTWSKLPFFETP
jgi:hypothetical protein